MLNDNSELIAQTIALSVDHEVDPTRMSEDVLELLLVWHTHVVAAGGPAGFHAFLCTAAPRYLSMIAHLRAKHREITQRIQNLRRMLDYTDGALLVAEFEAILHDIEVHDDLETELLIDALDGA